jgi:hypothetical protein
MPLYSAFLFLVAGYLLGLLFCSEDGKICMFFRNVRTSTAFTTQKAALFMFTAVRTSNPTKECRLIN